MTPEEHWQEYLERERKASVRRWLVAGLLSPFLAIFGWFVILYLIARR